MDKDDFRRQKSMLLEARVEIAVGMALRYVSRGIMKLGIGLHDLSNKLTTDGDAKHYEVERKRLLNEEESYRKFREDRGIGSIVPGSPDPEPVELVRIDPADVLSDKALSELDETTQRHIVDEIARLEFLRTNGELMSVREDQYLSELNRALFDDILPGSKTRSIVEKIKNDKSSPDMDTEDFPGDMLHGISVTEKIAQEIRNNSDYPTDIKRDDPRSSGDMDTLPSVKLGPLYRGEED